MTDFTAQAVTAALMIALVLGDASLLPFYGGRGRRGAVVAGADGGAGALARSACGPPSRSSRWRALMSESIVYTAATTLGVIYFQIVDHRHVAALDASSRPATSASPSGRSAIVNGVPWLLVASAFPILARAARDDQERLRYALQRLFDGSVVVGGFFSLCVVIGAPFAVRVIGGPKFEPSVEVLQILGVGDRGHVPGGDVVVRAAHPAPVPGADLDQRRARCVLAILLSAVLIPAHAATARAVATATLEVGARARLRARAERAAARPAPLAGASVPRVALAFARRIRGRRVIPVYSLIAVVVGRGRAGLLRCWRWGPSRRSSCRPSGASPRAKVAAMPSTIPLRRPKSDDYYELSRSETLAHLPGPYGRVLDVGCARRRRGGRAARGGASWITGSRCSPSQRRSPRASTTRCSSATRSASCRAPSGPFDTILCYDVLEHLYDPLALVHALLDGGRARRRGCTCRCPTRATSRCCAT